MSGLRRRARRRGGRRGRAQLAGDGIHRRGRTAGTSPAPQERGHVDQPIPIGRRHQVFRPGQHDRAGDALMTLGRGRGIALTQRGRIGLDVQLAARLGVDHRQHSDRGQRELTGIDHLDGDDLMPVRQSLERSGPIRGVEKIGDHHHLAPTGLGSLDAGQGRRQVGPGVRGAGGTRRVVQSRQRGQHPDPARREREADQLVAARHHHGEAVAAPDGEEAERRHHRQHHLAFLTLGGAEVQAGRAISHDPGLELAVGLGGAHIGGKRPGRQAPVDAPGIVAGLIGLGAGGFGAWSGDEAQVLAAQYAVETAGHIEFQPAQHRRLAGHLGRWRGGGQSVGPPRTGRVPAPPDLPLGHRHCLTRRRTAPSDAVIASLAIGRRTRASVPADRHRHAEASSGPPACIPGPPGAGMPGV